VRFGRVSTFGFHGPKINFPYHDTGANRRWRFQFLLLQFAA
jgi:hypothetical protein